MDSRGVIVWFPEEARDFSLKRPFLFWGPPSLILNVCLGVFPVGVKKLVIEAGHASPSVFQDMIEWIYTSIPSYAQRQLYLFHANRQKANLTELSETESNNL